MNVKDFYACQGNIVLTFCDKENDKRVEKGIGLITRFYKDGFITINPRIDGNVELGIVKLMGDTYQFTCRVISKEDYEKHYPDYSKTRAFINKNAREKKN